MRGKRVQLRCKGKLSIGNGVTLQDEVEINALCR